MKRLNSRNAIPRWVAPPAGAWIETCAKCSSMKTGGSPPPRGRGLKLFCHLLSVHSRAVAPPAGAWIETARDMGQVLGSVVAPPAGAWIETRLSA